MEQQLSNRPTPGCIACGQLYPLPQGAYTWRCRKCGHFNQVNEADSDEKISSINDDEHVESDHHSMRGLIESITNKVFTLHGDYTKWISKYYSMLSDPQNHIFNDLQFMTGLVTAGLIDGIINHLQTNKMNPQQVIASMLFITDLVSNQPVLSAKAFSKDDHKCVPNIINVIKIYQNDPYTLQYAHNALYALIQNNPNIINFLSPDDYALIEALDKTFTEADLREIHESLGDGTNNTLQQLLISRLSMFFESPSGVPEYYNILMDSRHECLTDTDFVGLLIECGLIKGIKHHLQQNKDNREDVICSAAFITHLLQKQPTFTKEIMDSCGHDIVDLIMPHSKDPDVLHTLCETIYTSICSDPNTISTFKQNGLEAALHKTADDDANDLLSVLKEQDQIMNELNLINTIAVQRMDNPDDIDELKEKLQSVITHIRTATNTPIRRNHRLILISEFDQLESYLNACNLSVFVWAKGLIRQMMNVAQYPRLKQIAITVHNVGKGSICIDYTLETYDIQLLDLAERNLHSADKNIAFPSENTESIKTDIDANNPQQPNEEVTSPHIGSATFIKQAYQPFVNLYKTPHGAEFAVDAGTIQFALQQMSDNPHANDCCVYAAKIIGVLAAECPAKSAKRLLSNDDGNGSGLSIISNTLRALHSDPNISAALIKLMDILCGLNSESIHALIDAGAVQSVLNVLIMFNSGSSLMHVLLLIVCMELLIKFTRSDGRVSDSIRQNGAMKSIGCIALAMDNNVESSQLIAVGRRALTEFVRQEDVHETMNIIARSQSDPDSFDRDMLHYAISIIGNMELIDANSQYVVSHNGIPLLLNIISDDAVDAILLSSTICALGRLLRTPKANAIWELKDGMKIFQDVINDCSYSEVIMLAMCDAINNMIKRKSELIPFITNKVFKSHSYYTQWVP
eukprot:1169229_1